MKQRVSNITQYNQPIVALHTGGQNQGAGKVEPVKLIATGDLEGASPAFQFVNQEGRITWASQDEFRVCDPAFLPPSIESITETLSLLGRGRA